MTSFSYLFEKEQYEDESPIHVYLFDGKEEVGEPVYISERIFIRMIGIGCAYNMHYLRMLDPYGDVVFNRVQVEVFIDELNFLLVVANDPLLHESVRELIRISTMCIYDPKIVSIKLMGN